MSSSGFETIAFQSDSYENNYFKLTSFYRSYKSLSKFMPSCNKLTFMNSFEMSAVIGSALTLTINNGLGTGSGSGLTLMLAARQHCRHATHLTAVSCWLTCYSLCPEFIYCCMLFTQVLTSKKNNINYDVTVDCCAHNIVNRFLIIDIFARKVNVK